jgi:predicted PurR-regulated permease PerM
VVLATVVGFAGLWAGRDVFKPLAVAAAFGAVLRPVVRWLRDRVHIPVPAGAALVLLALLGTLGAAGSSLQEPASNLLSEAPQLLARARTRVEALRRPLQRVTQALDPAAVPSRGRGRRADAATAASAAAATEIPGVTPNAVAAALQRLFGTTAGLISTTLEVLLLLFFLLAGDDRFLRRLVGGLHDPAAKRTAVAAVREAESHVGRYLGTLLLISAGQGAVVAVALWALGVANPGVWGLATAVLETLPYLGAAVMITALAVVGLASTDSLTAALAPPAVYLAVSTLQNSFVSPIAYGRRLGLNPFAILVVVIGGYALWGVAGVFLAVPAAAALNVVARHVAALAPLEAFLAD